MIERRGRRRTAVGIGLAVALLGGPVWAAEIDDAGVRAYYDAWSRGDVDAIMGYFSDDIVYADVATGAHERGTEAVRAFAQKFVDGNPGVTLEVASVTIGPKSAAVEWVMKGGSGDEAWSVPGVCVRAPRRTLHPRDRLLEQGVGERPLLEALASSQEASAGASHDAPSVRTRCRATRSSLRRVALSLANIAWSPSR